MDVKRVKKVKRVKTVNIVKRVKKVSTVKGVTYPYTQCAAVTIHCGWTSVPPHT